MLQGKGPEDLHTHCIALSAYMSYWGTRQDIEEAKEMAQRQLTMAAPGEIQRNDRVKVAMFPLWMNPLIT